MLEKNLTTYQLMDEVEKREFVQRFLNLCGCSERAFKVLENAIKREEEFCEDKHIKLPISNPHFSN